MAATKRKQRYYVNIVKAMPTRGRRHKYLWSNYSVLAVSRQNALEVLKDTFPLALLYADSVAVSQKETEREAAVVPLHTDHPCRAMSARVQAEVAEKEAEQYGRLVY